MLYDLNVQFLFAREEKKTCFFISILACQVKIIPFTLLQPYSNAIYIINNPRNKKGVHGSIRTI